MDTVLFPGKKKMPQREAVASFGKIATDMEKKK